MKVGQWARHLALAALLCAALFQLRPGPRELKRQLPGLTGSRGGRPHELGLPFGAMWRELVATATHRGLEAAPRDLSSPRVHDYLLATVATPRLGSSGGVRLIGVLGNFIVYRDRDDLLVLCTLLAVSLAAAYAAPGLHARLTAPRRNRPWTWVLSGFHCDGILGLLAHCTAVLNSGDRLQRDIGRVPLLALWLGAGVLATAGELLARRWPRPVGAGPATLAMLLHAVLLRPSARYSLFGMDLNGMSLLAVQMALPLAGGGAPLERASAGVCAGLVSFVVFSARPAQVWLQWLGMGLQEPQKPSSLAAPIATLHLLVAHLLAADE